MDTKKLHQITWKRARPIVLSLGVLLILIAIFTGFKSTNNWHRDQNFIHSQKAKEQYKLYIGVQKTKENFVNRKYKDSEEYQRSEDYAVEQNEGDIIKFDTQTGKFHIETQSFKEFFGYISAKLFYTYSVQDLVNSSYLFASRNVFQGFSLLCFFFIVAGFLVSFLNYKTNFLLLLFASGYNRKEILKSIVRTSLIPLIFMAVTAVSINLIILYSRIPHQYINYPLDKIIFYQFCLLLVAVCYYFLGLFSGVVLGQGITGVLSLIGFVYGVELIKQNLLNLFNNIFHNNLEEIYYQSFFVQFDTYSQWFILDSFVILTAFLFYFSSQYFYKRLSLEERGNYLLFPKFRLTISLVAGLFTAYSVFGNVGFLDEYGNVTIDLLIKYNILPGILVFVITFCFFMILNNYRRLYEKIGGIISKRNNQLSKK